MTANNAEKKVEKLDSKTLKLLWATLNVVALEHTIKLAENK